MQLITILVSCFILTCFWVPIDFSHDWQYSVDKGRNGLMTSLTSSIKTESEATLCTFTFTWCTWPCFRFDWRRQRRHRPSTALIDWLLHIVRKIYIDNSTPCDLTIKHWKIFTSIPLYKDFCIAPDLFTATQKHFKWLTSFLFWLFA